MLEEEVALVDVRREIGAGRAEPRDDSGRGCGNRTVDDRVRGARGEATAERELGPSASGVS